MDAKVQAGIYAGAMAANMDTGKWYIRLASECAVTFNNIQGRGL